MSPEMQIKLQNTMIAVKEEAELETLVGVLGNPEVQAAAKSHTLDTLIAAKQGHGTDYLNQYLMSDNLNRRAA